MLCPNYELVSKLNHAGLLAKARREDASFMGAVLEGLLNVPDDGATDYRTLKVLAANDYNGWLVVEAEQDPNKAHLLTYATMDYNNLKRMTEQAGMTVLQ